MTAWVFLILGWVLIFFHYPISGALLISFFFLSQWAKHQADNQKPVTVEQSKKQWHSKLNIRQHKADCDREIGCVGELGMGGPQFWDLMLRDGAIVHSACGAPLDLDDGKLRLIPTRSRQGQGLTLYIPAEKLMYDMPGITDKMWQELHSDPEPVISYLRAKIYQGPAIPLHYVRGLWLTNAYTEPTELLEVTLNCGRELKARSMLPVDLRYTEDPLRLLFSTPYELLLDNIPTGLFVCELECIEESPTGDCFSIQGVRIIDESVVDGLYYLHFAGEWFTLLSYAHKPEGGRGSEDTFFVSKITPKDGGVFIICFDVCGPDVRVPAPPVLAISVDWQDELLQLRTDNNSVTITLPNALVIEDC